MSEAELHLIRSRLTAGLRHKAARGELRQFLPVGFDYDEDRGGGDHPGRGGGGGDRHRVPPVRRTGHRAAGVAVAARGRAAAASSADPDRPGAVGAGDLSGRFSCAENLPAQLIRPTLTDVH